MPALSVIVPTHHRPLLLRKALEHLSKQTIASDLEVIVVHDGEDDGDTWRVTDGLKLGFSRFDYFSIPKSHQGVARNRGVEKATSPIVLFLQDDIFLKENGCEAHLKAHDQHKDASVLGYTTWDPECEITPTMKWLERVGWQFGYPLIDRFAHKKIPPHMQQSFTYTSHISLPSAVARKHQFREDVTLYGWEDIEWGMRLKEAGIPLVYEPDASALHHHHMEFEDSLKRIELLGRSAVTMNRINPSLGIVPRRPKYLIYQLIALLPTMWGKHAKAFLRGIAS